MTRAGARPAPPLAEQLRAAAAVLAGVDEGRSVREGLAAVRPELRAAALALSHAALRRWGLVLALQVRLVHRPPPGPAQALLRLALALLAPGDGIDEADSSAPRYAPHTVVDQAVTAARAAAPHQAGLINAVLRRYLREAPDLHAALADDLAARYNAPLWWIERLRADWPDHWTEILEAGRHHPPLTLRVNRRYGDVAACRQSLAAAGLTAAALEGDAIVVHPAVPVTDLPGFAEGRVSVQDLAAQRAVPLLASQLHDGARVLDACAAPGGKTGQLLEWAALDLLALDQDAARLGAVTATLERLGLHATCRAADAAQPATWWDGRPFDAILLDAPCTGSGIVRRHPDIPWLRRPGDIAQLATQQARLLDALWPLLAPAGVLLYATCSVFRAEGQAQVDAFLQRTPGAQALPSPGHRLPLPDNAMTRELAMPSAAATPDGFFYCRLARAGG